MYKEKERVKKGESRHRKSIIAKQEYIPAKKVLNKIDSIAENFRNAIQEGPVHVCSSFKRTLYRHSLKYVPKNRYKNTKKGSMEFVLTGYASCEGHEYIYMSSSNDVLESTCAVSITQRLPFMQICNLPRGEHKKKFRDLWLMYLQFWIL